MAEHKWPLAKPPTLYTFVAGTRSNRPDTRQPRRDIFRKRQRPRYSEQRQEPAPGPRRKRCPGLNTSSADELAQGLGFAQWERTHHGGPFSIQMGLQENFLLRMRWLPKMPEEVLVRYMDPDASATAMARHE